MRNGMKRCEWANSTELEIEYHDEEWGKAVHEDQLLFEMITLEGAQAGLSWSTILNKRKGYQKAFSKFDIKKVSEFSESKIQKLYDDASIVRHKLKINSTVTNAKCVLNIQKEFGSFDAYIWSFTNGKIIQNSWQKSSDVPTSTPESDAMSKDLKKRGFKFVGTTICYAYMQAIGMVNDHLTSCFCYSRNR